MRKITLSLMIGILISIIFAYAETPPPMDCSMFGSGYNATQLVWDDFEDGSINTSLWKATAGVTETSGYIRVDASGGWGNNVKTSVNQSWRGTVAIFNVTNEAQNGAGYGFSLSPYNSGQTYINATYIGRGGCGDNGLVAVTRLASEASSAFLTNSAGAFLNKGCGADSVTYDVYTILIKPAPGGFNASTPTYDAWNSTFPNSTDWTSTSYNIYLGGGYSTDRWGWVLWYSCEAPVSDTTAPAISYASCISCAADSTPDQAPYQTNATALVFNITTNESAVCAIANANKNYTAMTSEDSSRNCASNAVQHICSLQPSDALLLNETAYSYIACKDSSGNENTAAALEISMAAQDIKRIGKEAIEAGIKTSAVWPNATIYSSQQLYLRDLNNNQVTAVFDRFAAYGMQRWAFSYLTSSESPLSGLFNITSVLYAAEYAKMTFPQLNESVKGVINATRI